MPLEVTTELPSPSHDSWTYAGQKNTQTASPVYSGFRFCIGSFLVGIGAEQLASMADERHQGCNRTYLGRLVSSTNTTEKVGALSGSPASPCNLRVSLPCESPVDVRRPAAKAISMLGPCFFSDRQ